jgi:hypothetical protein
MIDDRTNAASGDLKSPVSPPLSTDPLPPISYTEAESRKAELFSNSEWFNRYMSGDVTAVREYNQIVQGLTAAPAAPVTENEAILDQLRRSAVIGHDVAEEILSGRPVTSAEREYAKTLRDHLFEDAEWRAKYDKGDVRARQQVAYINSILSRVVRDS